MQQDELNYSRIAAAIDYINTNFKQQSSLEEVAAQVNLSPLHIQRLFADWAGTTPKKFVQFISLSYSKDLLRKKQKTLFDVAAEVGVSNPGRLHDLYVRMEEMTPDAYREGGKSLCINYEFYTTIFGKIMVASTAKGVCLLTFAEDEKVELKRLKTEFSNASLLQMSDGHHQSVLSFFEKDFAAPQIIKLHLQGTPFQLKVWEALLKIPLGQVSTYGRIAALLNNTKASRAVGSAVGANPVSFIIPCHRVIQSTGHLGGYMWGTTRKTALLAWERAIADNKSLKNAETH